REFSWDRAARETMEVYREVAAVSRAGLKSRGARESSGTGRPPAGGPEVRLKPPLDCARCGPELVEGPDPTFVSSATDVLFGQAYFLRFDPKLWEAQQPYAPLGALYAAACVRDRGYRVALFDAMLAASEAEWADALDRHRPRFAV